jgi:hypothetical protein
MPADYLPFERISYRKPEITSIAESVWIWFFELDLIPPNNTTGAIAIWTIPTGYKAVISDVYSGGNFRGASAYWIPDGDNIAWIIFDDYSTKTISFTLPPVAIAGQTIYCQVWNDDIITGSFRGGMSMWNVPSSFPESVEKDDPIERFQKGDFSSCEVIIPGNGESIYTFRKRNEDKENYLRIQNYGTENQKIITAAHLTRKQKLEILSNLRSKPDKAKEILENFEKKIKKIK